MLKHRPIRRQRRLRWADSGGPIPGSGVKKVLSEHGSVTQAAAKIFPPIAAWVIIVNRFNLIMIQLELLMKCFWIFSGKTMIQHAAPGAGSICQPSFITMSSNTSWPWRVKPAKKKRETGRSIPGYCLLIVFIWLKNTIKNISCVNTRT